jgi:hypothetical protein
MFDPNNPNVNPVPFISNVNPVPFTNVNPLPFILDVNAPPFIPNPTRTNTSVLSPNDRPQRLPHVRGLGAMPPRRGALF